MLRQFLFTLPVAIVAIVSLQCGGKVDTTILPACGTNGSCSSDCKEIVSDCSGTYDLACTCVNGSAQCPELGAPSCQNDCNALAHGNYACSGEGEVCPSPTQLACINAPQINCTCKGGSFLCDAVPPCEPPPDPCPAPADVKVGAPCTGAFGPMCPTDQVVLDCDGNTLGYVECSCSGGTFGECVSPISPPCVLDAGSGG